MTLVRPEHRLMVEVAHSSDAKTCIEILEGLSLVLERDVLPASPLIDEGKAAITGPRRALFNAGLCLIPFPEAYGGVGLPFSIYAMAMELAGYSDAATAMSIGIHNTVSEGISLFGSAAQKEAHLRDLVTGRTLAAFALTEPSSGSDPKAFSTRAVRSGGRFLLQGSKTFITNGGEADLYLVFAVSEHGPSLFLVGSGTEGLIAGRDIPKLGMRGSRTSEVVMQNCSVPESALVGDEGKGLECVKQMLNSSRIIMAAICVGIARHAFERMLRYSLERKLGKGPLSDFQLTREKIANTVTEINAARQLYVAAALMKESRLDYSSEAAQAKLFAAEASVRACDAAIQVFGGYGYTDQDVHRHWRDARLLTMGEGTSEILRLLVARKELAKIH